MQLWAMASLWHWPQRSDLHDQASSLMVTGKARASHATQEDDVKARRYAMRSLRFVGEASVFFIAYAHEALARASLVLGNHTDALE